jgi:hypothetical protein
MRTRSWLWQRAKRRLAVDLRSGVQGTRTSAHAGWRCGIRAEGRQTHASTPYLHEGRATSSWPRRQKRGKASFEAPAEPSLVEAIPRLRGGREGVVRGRAIGVQEACDRRDLYGEPLSARALQLITPLPPDVFSPFLFERPTMLLLPKPAKSWPKTSGRGRDRTPKPFFATPRRTGGRAPAHAQAHASPTTPCRLGLRRPPGREQARDPPCA